ncbi:putative fumarylacetoacetate hydrolase [Phaeomoniella chlamydospora]|uniref:Putative fumarylacetoacetate hydrolase n=1 Tax=Phaeomoniella chlamydospora TaxID=158046 RepID=A0A0G2FTY0_PHACM|nr:putative fumarylacetoacetate hydrolase [Phaeomoniella chlamydospora]
MRELAAAAREKGMEAVAEIAVKTNFPLDRPSGEEETAEVRKVVSRCDAEAYARTAEVIASDDHIDPEYSKIKSPVVFVAGDGDIISPVQRSLDISELVGGPSRVIVVKSGHQMILQDLEGVQGAVDAFLKMTS